MILVDTSVWIEHLARGVQSLAGMLESGTVLVHPFVVGEIACGNLRDRETVIKHLHHLDNPVAASHDEVLSLIEKRQLMGQGIGYVDAHLLAATLLTPTTRLWTLDRRLQRAARRLDIHYTSSTTH
jgi:predicted nucleic acid-binding protein